jgi:hypothetical protein
LPSNQAAASTDARPPGKPGSDDGDPDCISFALAGNAEHPLYEFELPDLTPCQAAWRAAKDFSLLGYAHSSPEDFNHSKFIDSHEFKRAFRESVDKDPEPGHRWRSYSAFELRGRTASLLPSKPYIQTRQYNTDDGDKARRFRPLDPAIAASASLHELIRFNVSVAKLTNQSLFQGDGILIGVHMVSYRAVGSEVAFSSPVWLHRDQEEYVAVVLYELSHNVSGGENILANDHRNLVTKINLTEEFESLILSKSGMHAVVPMSSANGRLAFRNIILITFSPLPAAQ